MSNFKEICNIRTKYNSKEPDIEVRQNQFGTFLSGKLTWLAGTNKEGKPKFEWIYFSCKKDQHKELIMENLDVTFEVEGSLINKNWKDEKGNWKNLVEISIDEVTIYRSPQRPPLHFQEAAERE